MSRLQRLAACSPKAQHLFAGLWELDKRKTATKVIFNEIECDPGHFRKLFFLPSVEVDVQALIEELVGAELVRRFEYQDRPWLQLKKVPGIADNQFSDQVRSNPPPRLKAIVDAERAARKEQEATEEKARKRAATKAYFKAKAKEEREAAKAAAKAEKLGLPPPEPTPPGPVVLPGEKLSRVRQPAQVG